MPDDYDDIDPVDDAILEDGEAPGYEVIEALFDSFDCWDGLRLCSVCGDQETTNESGVCSDCQRQEWIDKHG